MLKRPWLKAAFPGLIAAWAGAVLAQTPPAPADLVADCGRHTLAQAEWAIQNAATCAIARDVYAACAAPSQYHLHSDLVHAFLERCERELEGRLSAAERRRLEREQAGCARGVADGRGVVGNFGERIMRECQARVAAKFVATLSQAPRQAPSQAPQQR